jgi:hypothetical protein
MKLNMDHTMKLNSIIALLTGVFLATGCSKGVPYEIKDGQPPEAAQRSTAPPTSEATCACYVVEGLPGDLWNQVAVREVSILKPHTAIARLASLTVGREYEVNFSCCDASGKEIYRVKKPHVFTATATSWLAYASFTPDHKIQKAGKWTWVAEIRSVGKFKTEVGILPPTPDDLQDIARYEAARENALRAFANYWLGVNGTFHTVISYERKMTDAEHTYLGNGPAHETRDDPSVGYIEIAGLEWGMTKGFTSEADKLNGITYRGNMSATFRVFRYHRNEGWTDWEDCGGLPSQFTAILGNFLQFVPSELSHKLNLDFTIMQRDGNWFVTTSSGDEFSNGKLVRADSQWKNVVPLPSYAEGLLRGARSFTRDSYQAMGEAARNDPAVVEQSAIATMKMLRGKELIR